MELDDVPQLALEGHRELVHPADGLEHRRLARALDHGANAVAEARLQERLEVVRVSGTARGGLPVGVVRRVEVTLGDEERDELLLVLGAQRQSRAFWFDSLGQEFARVAEQIGLDFAEPHALARERTEILPFVEEVRGFGFVDEDLERYPELLAVAEHACVPVRQSPRTAVQVQALVEIADLLLARTELRVRGAAADRPVDAADAVARFEDRDAVAKLAELVGHGHPRHAGAKDDDLGACRAAGEHRPRTCLCCHQVPRLHRAHHERGSADVPELLEERTSGQLVHDAGSDRRSSHARAAASPASTPPRQRLPASRRCR